MAPTLVATTTNTTQGTGTSRSVTVNYPAGTQAGDFVVAWTFSTSTGTTSGVWSSITPSGWTQYDSQVGSNVCRGEAFLGKFCDGETSASFGYTLSASTTINFQVTLLTFRGVDASAPVNRVDMTQTSGTNVTSYTSTNVITDVDDCMIVRVCGGIGASALRTNTWASSTERTDFGVTSGTWRASATSATKAQTTAGNTGTEVVTFSGQQSWPLGGIIAIAPQNNLDLTASDTGSGSTESQSTTAQLQQSDAASGIEAASQSIAVQPTQADTGTGTESQGLAATAPPASDTGTGTEAQSTTALIKAADTGSATETALVSNTVVGSDTGTGTDSSATLAVSIPTDTGSAADAAKTTAQIKPIGETATVSETAIGGSNVPVSDVLPAATESYAIRVQASDTGKGVDNASFASMVFASDSSSADESASVAVVVTDTSTSSDGAYIVIEGVGIIGERVARIARESRTVRAVRDPHVYQVRPENRLRIFGRDNRTVKVAPSQKDPARVYSVESETG